MTKLNTKQLMKVIDAMEDHAMIGETQVYVSGCKAVEEHAHVMTMHTEEEGYSHLLTIHTMSREVLCHELGHMHMHCKGTYNQSEPHNEEHEVTTNTMMQIVGTII